MSKEHIVRYKKGMKDDTDWARVNAMTDEDIDFSDNPETDEAFWANARLVLPEPKKSIGIRLDPDIIKWFKKQGAGYQTRINAVLRTYMQNQNSSSKRRKQKHA